MKGWMVMMMPVAMMALTGCFDMRSVYPIYTDATALTEPALVGTWQTKDAKEQLIVAEAGDHTYRLTYIDDNGEATRYELHLVKIGGTLVADLLPGGEGSGIPAHSFARMALDGDSLKITFLDSDTLREKAKEAGLAYTKDNEFIALVAPTAAVRAFIEKNLPQEAQKEPDAEFLRAR